MDVLRLVLQPLRPETEHLGLLVAALRERVGRLLEEHHGGIVEAGVLADLVAVICMRLDADMAAAFAILPALLPVAPAPISHVSPPASARNPRTGALRSPSCRNS